MENKRSFTVVKVVKSDGCVTKHHKGSRLVSRTPAGAAKKATTALCSHKKVRGVCTLYVTVKETTRGSKGKSFTYKCKRSKLKKPVKVKDSNGKVLYTVEYEVSCHSHKGSVPKKSKQCKMSTGVMSKRSKLLRRQK